MHLNFLRARLRLPTHRYERVRWPLLFASLCFHRHSGLERQSAVRPLYREQGPWINGIGLRTSDALVCFHRHSGLERGFLVAHCLPSATPAFASRSLNSCPDNSPPEPCSSACKSLSRRVGLVSGKVVAVREQPHSAAGGKLPCSASAGTFRLHHGSPK